MYQGGHGEHRGSALQGKVQQRQVPVRSDPQDAERSGAQRHAESHVHYGLAEGKINQSVVIDRSIKK